MKVKYNCTHSWDYSALKARTVELEKTDKDVAAAGNMTPSTYSLKLNNKGDFTQVQIVKICAFLGIDFSKIPRYFFTPKV